MIAGPNNTLFAATQSLVLRLSSEGRVIARAKLPRVLNVDLSMAQTRNGEIWLGHNGIYKVVEHGKELVLHPENVPMQGIADLQYDRARDILWACDGNNVFFRKDGVWGKIASRDGLLDMRCFRIGIEADGDVWVGYGADAVSWIRNPSSGHPMIQNFSQRLEPRSRGHQHTHALRRSSWMVVDGQ